MEILVCIKQVPDTTEIRIDPETNTLIPDSHRRAQHHESV